MSFWGLIPSASAAGERRQPGAITQAGKTQARRALVEGAWASRYPAKVSRHLQLRLEKQSKLIQDISGQARAGWVNATVNASPEANMPPWPR